MGEYWKSLPKKFCDACKCWFADNKASIQFHEQGKKHKENAAKRIQDIQKRGLKEAKKQKEYDNDMAKIEKAAMAAYEKDLKRMDGVPDPEPNLKQPVSNIQIKEPKAKAVKSSLETVQKKIEDKLKAEKTWYEAVSEEGHKYFYNSKTSESQWEPPEEGFVSLDEQNEINERMSKVKESSEDISSFGPQPKADPYGQWQTIEKEEPVEYDLQLPEKSENAVEVVIPLYKEEKSFKFNEKVVGRLSGVDPGEVTFKKRKFAGSSKKNARQRTTDDD